MVTATCGRRLAARLVSLAATVTLAAATVAASGLATQARAQTAPVKPMRFVVPLGPGSGADTMTRFIARRYELLTGQPAVVENRPGGSLVVGTMSVVSAPADGRSILYITPSPVVINPIVEKDLPYDPQRDLRPVVSATRAAAVMVVSSASRFKTFADVIATARAAPGTVSYANYGYFYRFAAMALEQQAGVTFNHVLYKGAAQANTDLIGGQIDVHTFDVGGAVPLIKSGALRPLAVTGKTRHPYLPDVPTIAELGYPKYEEIVWTGYGVHSKTPEPLFREIEENLLKILNSPEFAAFNETQGGGQAAVSNGKDFGTFIASETVRYRELAKGLK